MITINFDNDDHNGLIKITQSQHHLDVLLTPTAAAVIFDVLDVVLESADSYEIPEKVKIEYRRLRKERSRRTRAV